MFLSHSIIMIKRCLLLSLFIFVNQVFCAVESAEKIETESASQEVTFNVTRSDCKVYFGPGWQYEKIGLLKKGAFLTILGNLEEWYFVELKDRRKGWVNKKYGYVFIPEKKQIQSAKEKTQDKKTLVWAKGEELIAKMEEEYNYILVVENEIEKLLFALEDMHDLLLYPLIYNKFSDKKILTLQDFLDEHDNQIKFYLEQAKNLKTPLVDAIGIFQQILLKKPDIKILGILAGENRIRVKNLITLKRKINQEWKMLDNFIKNFFSVANIKEEKDDETKGIESEFFRILYSNLGRSSEYFSTKLNALKDSLIVSASPKEMRIMALIDFKRCVNRFRNKRLSYVEKVLSGMAKRYWKKIETGAINYYLGETEYALNNLKLAEVVFSRVPPESNYYLQALVGLERIYFVHHKWQKAVDLYDKIKDNVHSSKVLGLAAYLAGQCFLQQKAYDKVVGLTQDVSPQDDYFINLLYLVGQAYYAKGDFELAKSVFAKIATLVAKSKKQIIIVERAKLNLANIHFELREFTAARKNYLVVLEGGKNFSEAMFGLVWCYIAEKDFDNAELALKKMINQSPEHVLTVEAFLVLANRYLQKAGKEYEIRLQLEKERKRLTAHKQKILRALNKVKKEFRQASGERKIENLKGKISQLTAVQERIEIILTEVFEKKNIDYHMVETLYTQAIRLCKILINTYQSGNYLDVSLKGKRQTLMFRIDAVLDNIKGRKLSQVPRLRREKEENQKAEINMRLDFVEEAYAALMTANFLYHNWKKQTYKRQVIQLNNQIKGLKENLVDQRDQPEVVSLLKEELALLVKNRSDFIRQSELDRIIRYWQIIRFGEELINKKISDDIMPTVLFVLGEGYYEAEGELFLQEQTVYEEKYLRYDEEMEKYENKKIARKPLAPLEPLLQYKRSKRYLKRLVKAYPNNPLRDAGLYSLGFSYFESNHPEIAKNYLSELVRKYPQSEYAPQAYIIIGEYYFDSNNLKKAVMAFSKVLEYTDSDYYNEALYKLGWSYYRLSYYAKAISTFKYLLDDSDRLAKLNKDTGRKIKNILNAEAIDYIAISFSESDTSWRGGLALAKRFVKMANLGKSERALILHRLGDKYNEQGSESREKAVQVYKEVLRLFPAYKKAPFVANYLALLYEKNQQYDEMINQKWELVKKYNLKNGDWKKIITDENILAQGDSIAESAMHEIALFYHAEAGTKEGNASKKDYRKAKSVYQKYLDYYNKNTKSYEVRYNLAEIEFGLENYAKAAKQYIRVSQDKRSDKYKENAAWNAIVSAKREQRQKKKDKMRRSEQGENNMENTLVHILNDIQVVPKDFEIKSLKSAENFKQVIKKIRNKTLNGKLITKLVKDFELFNGVAKTASKNGEKTEDEIKVILISFLKDLY